MGGRFVEGRFVEGRSVEGRFVEGHYVEGRFVVRTFCSEGRFVEGRFVVVPLKISTVVSRPGKSSRENPGGQSGKSGKYLFSLI